MKLSLLTWTAAAGIVKAAYPGDIVYYWHVHASLYGYSPQLFKVADHHITGWISPPRS